MKSHGLKLSLAAALLAGVAVTATAANAEESGFLGGLSAYVAGTSDYRYRGISQNNKEFTPQASLNWSNENGVYIGTWVSKTNWGDNNPSYEVDVYAGKHIDFGEGTDLNVQAYYYGYPDYKASGAQASYFEIISQLSHSFDALTLTATGAYSPKFSLEDGTGWYGAVGASYALSDWLSVGGNYGHQWTDSLDYNHWDFGVTATYKSFALDVRYVDSDAGCGNLCDANVVVMLTYSIEKLF